MALPGFNKHGSARMERGTILICIFSIFIFVQDVPYYNHAAGSQASMIIGKILALISLRGVVSDAKNCYLAEWDVLQEPYIAKAILGFSLNRDLVRNRFIKRIRDDGDLGKSARTRGI